MYKQLIDRVNSFMELSGKSQAQVAKEATLSGTVLSQFLNGSYPGNNEEVANILTKYLELVKKRSSSISHVQFNEKLGNTQTVMFACEYAHMRNDIALVCGDAGAGKTAALELYRDRSVGVVMVTANACTTSATAVLKLIYQSVKRTAPGRRDLIMAELVEYFQDSNRLIIIDEADNLTLAALQAVRNLNDRAKVGIVLSGNDKIYTQMLVGSRSSEFQQLRTRIIVRRKVENRYSLQEFREIFPGLCDDCLSFLIKLAQSESLRTAIKILEIAFDYTGTQDMTVKALKAVKLELAQGLY